MAKSQRVWINGHLVESCPELERYLAERHEKSLDARKERYKELEREAQDRIKGKEAFPGELTDFATNKTNSTTSGLVVINEIDILTVETHNPYREEDK